MARGELPMANVLRPYRIEDFAILMALRDFHSEDFDNVRKEKVRAASSGEFDESMRQTRIR